MEHTSLRWSRARAELEPADAADLGSPATLHDRVEQLEQRCAALERANAELARKAVVQEHRARGEYTVRLSEADERRMAELHARGQLAFDQEENPGMGLTEAFECLVTSALDVAWDSASYQLEGDALLMPKVTRLRARARAARVRASW